MAPSLLIIRELAHDLERAAVEITDILDAVLHHGESGQTQAEREAGVLFGVDAAVGKYLVMDYTAAQEIPADGS